MVRKDVIYARYSSDMQSPKSCADQEREVREAAGRLGIDLTDALVIHDEAESGTKTDRACFERLDAMMKAGQIRRLFVDDQSRLTRACNAFAFITDLVFHGGRFISTGEGLDTTQQGWQLRVKVLELHNSETIGELARRVRRGQIGRLLAKLTAGDYPFGYESFLLRPEQAAQNRRGPKPEKDLRILEPQAKWVREIFAWFLAGRSINGIAEELNRRKVSTGSRRQNALWNDGHIRIMLDNDKYIGHWEWGTTTTIRNSAGKKKQVPVPPEQWIVTDRQDLRIIDQETWIKAQDRLRYLNGVFGKKEGQKQRGPKVHHTAVYPQDLLPGLLFCNHCGSRLWHRSSGSAVYLGCPKAGHVGGMCPMTTTVRVEQAEEELLGILGRVLKTWPAWLQTAVEAMRAKLQEAAKQLPEDLAQAEQRLGHLKRQISNLVDLLVEGGNDSNALRARLAVNEEEVEQLERVISKNKRLLSNQVSMPDETWIQSQLADIPALLSDDRPRLALILRKLLGKVFVDHVVAPGKKRGYPQLRFKINGIDVLEAVMGDRLPDGLVDPGIGDQGASPDFVVNLGGPAKMDKWAPKIAEMRARGVRWKEIWEITGLGSGPAYVAWKRYIDSQKDGSAGEPQDGEQDDQSEEPEAA